MFDKSAIEMVPLTGLLFALPASIVNEIYEGNEDEIDRFLKAIEKTKTILSKVLLKGEQTFLSVQKRPT